MDNGIRLGRAGVPRWVLMALALAALSFAGASVYFLLPSSPSHRAPVVPRRSLAVLYFENHTGDRSLDWLRSGLTERMVRDLSRSSALRVLSTERVQEVMREIGPNEATSLEVARKLAENAEVDAVLFGSFTKAGESISIRVHVREARTGDILAMEKIQGEATAILSLVDDLAQKLKARFEIPGHGSGPALYSANRTARVGHER